ncbi:MAG: hypothetical protein ACI8YQ_000129 [Polaribacter sp.]|jgi:hypothetical protein
MGSRKVDVNPFNSILSIVFLVAIFIGLYYLATGIFTILSALAPFMLLGALIINYKVVLNYGKWLLNTLKTNFLRGLGMTVLTVLGFPVISGYLLLKAFLSKKVEKMQADFEDRARPDFADFEEVDNTEADFEDLSNEKPLDLNAPKAIKPEIRQNDPPKRNEDGSEYDQFFQ